MPIRYRDSAIKAMQALIGRQSWNETYARLGLSPRRIDALFGLDDLERLAIWIYSTPNDWHHVINAGLWSRPVPAHVKVFASVLNRAIRKLPRVEGTVFRGLTLPDDRAEFLKKYILDRTVTWPAFTSATRHRNKAFFGTVLFRITSKAGRSLQGYSADEIEEEVLFEAGTKFRVRDRFVDERLIVIDVDELQERKVR
jgi:hypothetical protein